MSAKGQSFFHAFDPEDRIFSHNIFCGHGMVTAVSLQRHAQPEWAGIMSPYERFTRERPKEEVFERVRAQEFGSRPPRLGSIFLFATRESAEACNADWWGGAHIILEARIVAALSAGIFDSLELNAPQDQWEVAARRYWAAEFTPDPRPEVVVCGTIQLIDWQRHARLLAP